MSSSSVALSPLRSIMTSVSAARFRLQGDADPEVIAELLLSSAASA